MTQINFSFSSGSLAASFEEEANELADQLPESPVQESWCLIGDDSPRTIQLLQELAAEYGGEVISQEVIC